MSNAQFRQNLSNAPVPARRPPVAFGVALLPLTGHEELRTRLLAAVATGRLPGSLLLYGPRGVGKERLALWLATRLLCETLGPDGDACGSCQHCSYAARGAHPDLHWYFPRPRARDGKQDSDDVLADYAEAIAERIDATGAWAPADATDNIYVYATRAIVTRASFTPALAKRKAIVVADAERMVPQEASPEAANAFLKLLEEPPSNTTIILTSSAPASLLPTIRSRVVSVRVAPHPLDTARTLAAQGVIARDPGDNARAQTLLDAALGSDADRYRAALGQGARGARGDYAESLDALVALLHERARSAAQRGDDARATGAARAVAMVEEARRLTSQNINPQVLTARLLFDLAPLLS